MCIVFPNDTESSLIFGKLYVGSVLALVDPTLMGKVNVVVSLLTYGQVNEAFLSRMAADTVHVRFHVKDRSDQIGAHLHSLADFLHSQLSQDRTVLVHCLCGHSRSPTAVMAYMLKYLNFETPEAALTALQKGRPSAKPHAKLMEVLTQFAESLHKV